jgi:nitrogen fixation protein FixH
VSAPQLVREAPNAGGGLFWALVPVVLLVASVGGVGTMAAIATRDPGFALEKNYYDRAVHWDREQAQRTENARLAWRIVLELAPRPYGAEVVVRVLDRAGVSLQGAGVSAEAFANARAGDRRSLLLEERPDGTYRAALPEPRPGVWEIRLVVLRGGSRFTEVVRAEVPARMRP